MFDFAFSEIALVGVVALIVIGPKDMPVAIKAVTDMIKKARRMAGEFQGHVDEMVREANLHEVRDSINELRSMNVKNRILSAVDDDGSIRRALNDDPLRAPSIVTPTSARTVTVTPVEAAPVRSAQAAPAFVPPADSVPPAPATPAPPAFIPPSSAEPRA